MFSRQRLPSPIAERAAQPGAITTTRELRECGVTPDGIRSLVGRELTRLAGGVHAIAPSAGWDHYLAASLVLAGDGGTAFGTTALALHELGPRVLPIEVLARTHDRPRGRPWVRFVRSDYPGRVVEDKEPPRIALEDTVIDVVGTLDELDAIALVSRALQERRTAPQRLSAVVDRRRRVRHRALLDRILADAAGIESALERVYDDLVVTAHALPPMRRQYVVPGSGHRSDGAYLDARALVELDGAAYHDRKRDRALDNRHAGLGWVTFRFGWADCWVTPCSTARVLWGGPPPKRCRRCPAD
ncbi:hypothetical protein [Cumulibacter manganitolerans]|uniref:hypothetical protein n=1 Tax=Cumulibacter manganitolerans TaxID=1884992 RepID=UPI001295DA28|nr:hypothetical protein [Cumulibacter manganitolerans]